jgi:hypothetical protein
VRSTATIQRTRRAGADRTTSVALDSAVTVSKPP